MLRESRKERESILKRNKEVFFGCDLVAKGGKERKKLVFLLFPSHFYQPPSWSSSFKTGNSKGIHLYAVTQSELKNKKNKIKTGRKENEIDEQNGGGWGGVELNAHSDATTSTVRGAVGRVLALGPLTTID